MKKIIVIMLFSMGVSGVGNVYSACSGYSTSQELLISSAFVGNTNAIIRVHLHSCYPILGIDTCYPGNINIASATVYRNGQSVGTVTADGYVFKTVQDTGLTKGQSYTYTVVGNCGVPNATPLTVTAGEVRGRIDRNMTLDSSSGDFVLSNDYLDRGITVGGWNNEPVTLTIKSGAVVDGTKSVGGDISIGVNSKIIVDGATLKGIYRIEGTYAPGSRLDISNSTVENGWIFYVETLSVKNSVLKNVKIEYIDNFVDQQAFSTNSGSNVDIKLVNSKGLMNYINFSGIKNIPGMTLDLTLEKPAAVIDINNNDFLHGAHVSSQDSTVNIRNNTWGNGIRVSLAKNVTVEGNQEFDSIYMIDLPTGSFTRLIRNNTVGYIYLDGASGFTIERNETDNDPNGYGIWIKKGSNNVVKNNRVYTSYPTFSSSVPSIGIFIGDKNALAPAGSTGNQIINNRIIGFDKGIGICANSNVISGNIVSDTRFPIVVGAADEYLPIAEVSGNSIYDNMFIGQNWGKIFCASCTSVWNMNKTAGPNIVGGNLKGGNYWSVYTEKDNDQDGFIDRPYKLNNYNTDALPLPASLIVNKTTDEGDANLSDGRCDTDMVTVGDQCTLRAAIQTANVRAGDDLIIFTESYLTVKAPLPAITGKVTINGYTQSDVTVDGAAAGNNVDGLQVNAANSKIMGITIQGFSGHGIYATQPIDVEGITLKDNKKWGIYTKANLKINAPKQFTAYFDNNGTLGTEGGGVFSEQQITAYKCAITNNQGPGLAAIKDIIGNELKINSNKASGIQSLQGKIKLENTYTGGINQISGNEGPGMMTGNDMMLPETGDGMSGLNQNIEIQRPIEIRNNSGWGIIAQNAAVYLNAVPGSWLRYHTDTNYVTGNGDTSKPCRYLIPGGTRVVQLVQPTGAYHAGGIGARSLIHANFTETLNNKGGGIIANGDIYLSRIKVNANKGPGIVSRLGEVYIPYITAGVTDGNQVIGNEGVGIMTGENMLFSNTGGAGGDITISTDIRVQNNAGWGIFSQQGLYVNTNTNLQATVSTFPVSPATSYVTGNGDKTKPCWLVNTNGQLELLNNPYAVMGGIAAKNRITANLLEITVNKGNGVVTNADLKINTGKICGNTGGDMLVGGIKILTNVTLCDADNDGISDGVEGTADGNQDGILDNQQKNVATISNSSGKPTTVASDSTTALSNVHLQMDGVGSQSTLGFTVAANVAQRDFVPGSSTIITIWLSAGETATNYFAYGPTIANATPHWYQFLYDGTTGAKFTAGKIILYFKDGGRGDNDLTANGKIVHEGSHLYNNGKPDFVISSVVLNPTIVTMNNTFTATVTVKNQGTSSGDGKFLDVWGHYLPTTTCGTAGNLRQSVGILAVGTSKILTFTVTAASAGMKTFRAFVDSGCGTTEINDANNQATVIYEVNKATNIDLTVSGVTLNPTAPTANGTFTATLTAKNQGTVASSSGFVTAWANQAATQTCGAIGSQQQTVASLAANASKAFTFNALPAGTAGMKMFRTYVDSACATAETIERNNQGTATYAVNQVTGIDFIITNIVLTPAAPIANGKFIATVTVKNQGIVAGDGKNVEIWHHQPSTQVCGTTGVQRQTVGALATGATKVLTFNNLPAGIAVTKTLRAYVDSTCGTAENNEANNQMIKAYTVQ